MGGWESHLGTRNRTRTSAGVGSALTTEPLASLINILISCTCVATRAAENMMDVRINTCGGSRCPLQTLPGAEPSCGAEYEH